MHRSAPTIPSAMILLLLPLFASTGACGGPDPEPSPPCEQKCQDGNAMRALRETMKLVFNLTLQGNPVGAQDESTLCPMGGTGRVFGQATANAIQGAIEVDLTYELAQCAYLQRDEDPPENYDMTLTGTVLQKGTIAVQPSVTTALNMSSDAMTFSGNVYDPPLDYDAENCPVVFGQSGNRVSGTICEREAGVSF